MTHSVQVERKIATTSEQDRTQSAQRDMPPSLTSHYWEVDFESSRLRIDQPPVKSRTIQKAQNTATSTQVKDSLLIKLREVPDENIYVLEVETPQVSKEDTPEAPAASDPVAVITTVATLVTALTGLLNAVQSYKEKKNRDSSGEVNDKQLLVQINIYNHKISISHVDVEVPRHWLQT